MHFLNTHDYTCWSSCFPNRSLIDPYCNKSLFVKSQPGVFHIVNKNAAINTCLPKHVQPLLIALLIRTKYNFSPKFHD
ncbi:hypothetical protein QL285_092350 [Trifolium repens]|nr:hypothetical protein QL285_092350 [Trifolium repens]